MASILTVASSKGGGGKTALTCCLAPNLAKMGYRVGVIDADPNATFTKWFAHYEAGGITSQAEAGHNEVIDLAHKWVKDLDVVLFDTAGFGNLTAAAAMTSADHVLVPCPPDRGSTIETVKTIRQVEKIAQAARREIRASVVLSQWRQGGVAEKAALEDLEGSGIQNVLKTAIPNRTSLRQMTFSSQPLTTGEIGHTIRKVIRELIKLDALEDIANREIA